MRTKNAFSNISFALVNNVLLNVLRFVTRTIFIHYLSSLYLGVNGLLSNVLGILSLADLGISTAIGFSLYKPLAENDKEKIKSLMAFFKKAYRIIALIVLVIGLGLLPFLDVFVDNPDSIPNLWVYYLVFLFNMVVGYLFSYMRTLMIADQKEHKITKFVICFNLTLTGLQILVLILFKNYLIYLLVQSLVLLVENIVINNYIVKEYPYLKEKNVEKLDQEDKKSLTTNVKALLFHKIGSYFVDSTDNLIISKFLGLVTVGLYSNYYLITSTFSSFLTSALWGSVASFGNLNVMESEEKRYSIYKVINLIGFTCYGVIAICLFQLFNLFVKDIWLGKEYILGISTVIIICINFYVSGMMHVNDAIKSSGGLYDKDKFVPLIQSAINIVASIILVKYYGLTGVFIGTLLSSIVPTIVKPYIIYKYLFNRSCLSYFVMYFKQLAIILISALIVVFINSKITISSAILAFIVKGIISASIPLLLIFICYFKTETFAILKDKIKVILKR